MSNWKPVVGYEGLYEVSDEGEVFSIFSLRKLKPNIRCKNSNASYYCVHLSKDKKAKIKNVHRLVAEAFIENPLNKSRVNHIDGNKLNNSLSNLEWVTPSENCIHSAYVLGNKNKINKEGLKLGSLACIKTNLNITNGEKTFNTYKEIINFLISKGHKIEVKNEKNIKSHVRDCCNKKQKSAYGYKWEYNNKPVETIHESVE